MRNIIALAAVAALIAAPVTLMAVPAWADSSIKVDQVWARATPGAAKTGAIYLTITNTGTTPDTLEGTASTPVANHADVHEMKMANGEMQMRPVKSLTSTVPSRRNASMTSSTSTSGAEAPAVMPTVWAPLNHSGCSSLPSAIR